MITVERRKVKHRGTCTIGWFLGHGHVREDRTFTMEPWCVLENGKVLAECRSQAAAQRIRAALVGEVQP